MPTGSALVNFPVGDATRYAPVTLTPNAAITSGSIGVKVTAGSHPNQGTSGLLSGQVATRYWTITNSNIIGPTLITPKLTYQLADIPGGNNSTYVMQKYSSGAWLASPLSAINASYTTTASAGITVGAIVGDYIVGNSIAAITGITSICAGTTTNLSDATAGGTWSTDATSVATVDASGVVTGIAPGDAAINYNTTSGSVTATVTVKVRTDIGSAINSGPTCAGSNVQLTAAATGVAPMIYSWTGPNAYNSTGSPVAITAANILASGTYTVIATGVNGCRDTATTTVVVHPVPVLTTTSNNGPVCAGDTLVLTTAASGGDGTPGYAWYGPAGFASPSQLPVVSSSVSAAAAGIYTVVVTDANNCSDTAMTTAIVYALPVISSTVSNGPLCAGANLQLTALASGSGILAYSWSGPNSFSAPGSLQTVAGADSSATGVYTMVVTDANGCRDTATTAVVVNSLPVIAGAGNSGPVCAGAALSLNIVASGAGSLHYSWAGPDSYASTDQAPLVSPHAAGTATGIYTVVVTDGNDCRDTATTATVVYPVPSIADVSNNGPVCAGNKLMLGSNAAGGTGDLIYSWSGPNAYSATGQHPDLPGASLVAAGTYTVAVSDEHSCADTALTTVSVVVAPVITAISNSAPVCEGGTLRLATTVTGGSGAISYSWSGPNGFGSTNEDPTVSALVTTDADGLYTLVATDTNGCAATGVNSTSVVVYPLQPITGATTVLFGQTISLSNAVPGGSWSTPMPWTAKVTSPAGTVKGVSAGAAQITYTTAHGCEATYTVTVLSGLNVCAGQSIALSDGVSGGNWTSSNGSIASVTAATGVVAGVSAGKTIITHSTVTGFTTTTITVNPLSVTTAAASVCQGQVMTLVNNTPGGGTWYSSNTAIATVSNTGIMSSVIGGTVTVYYTPVAGCVTTKVITIIPVSPITGPSSVCMGQTINVSNSMAGGAWSTSSGSQATVSAAGVVKGIAAGAPRLSYIWPTGCQSIATITVKALSPITGGTAGICASSGMTLANITPFGGTWSSGNTSVATVSATGFVKGTGTGMTVISYTTTAGACVATRAVTVNACRELNATEASDIEIPVANDVRLFPNPNRGIFVVNGSIESSEATVEVMSMTGQVIYRGNIAGTDGIVNAHIELPPGLANGMYLLHLRGDGWAKTLHFVVAQ